MSSHSRARKRRKMACVREIRYDEMVNGGIISSDGELLALITGNSGVQILQIRSGELLFEIDETATCISCMAFSPACHSPRLFATGSFDGSMRVWDCVSRACVAKLQTPFPRTITFSPNGCLLTAVTSYTDVQLWRTDDWNSPPTVLANAVRWPFRLTFSCDSRLLVSFDGNIKLWQMTSNGVFAAVAVAIAGPALQKTLSCLAFSPVDNRLLAWGSQDGSLVLGRVSEGAVSIERTLERAPRGYTIYEYNLTFSPCGQKLASILDDRSVWLWSMASGACIRVSQRHTRSIFGMAFFSNSKQLVTGCWDKIVRIWTLCPWCDFTHHLFSTRLKAAVFNLMCVRARLEQKQEQLPRLPMEVWLLIFGQLQLVLDM